MNQRLGSQSLPIQFWYNAHERSSGRTVENALANDTQRRQMNHARIGFGAISLFENRFD
jgi:hypothetical protein